MFYLFYSLDGFVFGIFFVAFRALTARINQLSGLNYFGWVEFTISAGFFAGPLLVALTSGSYPLINLYYVFGTITVVFCFIGLTCPIVGFVDPGKTAQLSWPNRVVLFAGLLHALMFFSLTYILNWPILWFSIELNLASSYYILPLLFFFCGQMITQLGCIKMLSWFGPLFSGVLLPFLGSIIFIMMLMSQNIYLIIFAFFVIGLASGPFIPILLSQTIKRSPHISEQQVMGDVTMIATFGSMLSPIILGLIAASFNITFLTYCFGMLWFLLAFGMLFMFPSTSKLKVER